MVSCTSLLNCFLSTIIDPSSCYLDYLIIPQSFYHQRGFHRAFEERLESIPTESWSHEWRKQPIQVLTTSYPIPPTLTPVKNFKLKSSSVTAVTSIIHVKGRPT